MDVAHPIRAVVPSLDGPVLEALAGTTLPLTTLEIHRLAGVGSSMGVRRVLERLAGEGIAKADHRGNAIYYSGNRNHLAWPAVEMLAGLRRAMCDRISALLDQWLIPPIHASLFGSTARADGDANSDIDVLVIKPALAPADDDRWDDQADHLRSEVLAITGNRCQVFVLTTERLLEHLAAGDRIVDAWLRDGVHLFGDELSAVVARLPQGAAR